MVPTIVVGSPSASNTLVSVAGTWTVSGPNAGSFGPLSFTGIGSLSGSNGSTYVMRNGASLSGTLTGGGSKDTLNYAGYGHNVVVDLQTGQASGIGNLAGSFGTVIGANGGGATGVYNILVGNAGTILVGGTGRRNLLIAGPQAATLTAGDQGDILIAGDTAYDQQAGLTALKAIMGEWTRTGLSYATRVQVITRGTTTIPALNATKVHSNGGGNVLHDPSGLDWLFVRMGADSYTRLGAEKVVNL
jgi:hypothetical protein